MIVLLFGIGQVLCYRIVALQFICLITAKNTLEVSSHWQIQDLGDGGKVNIWQEEDAEGTIHGSLVMGEHCKLPH